MRERVRAEGGTEGRRERVCVEEEEGAGGEEPHTDEERQTPMDRQQERDRQRNCDRQTGLKVCA